MPDAVMIAEAVGVTGQTRDGLDVEFLAVVRRNDFIMQINNFIRAVQYAIALFTSPFSQNDTSDYLKSAG
jgi:hypothetical protein